MSTIQAFPVVLQPGHRSTRAPFQPPQSTPAQPPVNPASTKHDTDRLLTAFSEVASRVASAAADKAVRAEQPRLEAMIRAVDERVNAAAITKMVDDRLEQLAPRRIEVYSGQTKLGSIDEHTRPEFETIAKRVMSGVNVMLVGPAGSGKTYLADQIARALGLRFSFLPLTAGVSESRLVGRFCPIGENGRFEYMPAPFVDLYENGGVFLADEMDAADSNVLLCLNAALANGHMETPNPAKPIIKRHKDFRMIAAANTWGHGANRQYVGRNQLDASTLDRFAAGKFEIGYDEPFERKVGHADLTQWAQEIRRKVEQNSIRRVVSTRYILDGTKAIAGGATVRDIQQSFLLDWTENELAQIGWRS